MLAHRYAERLARVVPSEQHRDSRPQVVAHIIDEPYRRTRNRNDQGEADAFILLSNRVSKQSAVGWVGKAHRVEILVVGLGRFGAAAIQHAADTVRHVRLDTVSGALIRVTNNWFEELLRLVPGR